MAIPDNFPWDQLNTLKISDAPSTEVNLVTKPLHLEKANKDALQTTVLINNALFRSDSAIIPGTMKIVSVDGTTDANNRVMFYEPAEGELWRILDIGAIRTGSGTVNYYPVYYDNVLDKEVPILDHPTSHGIVQFDTWPESAAIIDSRVSIGMYHTSGTVTDMEYMAVLGQIR